MVKEGDLITVDRLPNEEKESIDLETLAVFGDKTAEFGSPVLEKKTKAQVVKNLKGDKIRVSHFKAKVRYRKVRGFRAYLSQIKIEKI